MENLSPIVKVYLSDQTWIDSKAIWQLHETAKLPGMTHALGYPDLHPGTQFPIGTTFVTENWTYPQLIGSEIGCGMGLWSTNLSVKKLQIDKIVQKLKNIESLRTRAIFINILMMKKAMLFLMQFL